MNVHTNKNRTLTEEILQERARVYAKKTEETKTAGELKKFLSWRLADEHYLMDLNLVEEVVPPGRIFRIPRQKEFVLGVMNIRGGLVVVIDPAVLFHAARKDLQKRSGLILLKQSAESAPLGLLVDKVQGSIILDTGLGQPQVVTASGTDREFFKGLFEKDGKPFTWLDIPALMDEATRRLKMGMT